MSGGDKRRKLKKDFLAVFLCLGFLIGFDGCKKKEEALKIEMIEGVEYIHNPSTPVQPTKTVVFEEEFSFQEKDETDEIRLFKPSSYAVDAQDRIYISDDSDLSIKVFDRQGKYLRSFGRRGSGPGEFAAIRGMVILPDGRILVTDDWQRRTSVFSPEGQFLSSFQWKKNYTNIYIATNSSFTVEEQVFSEGQFERSVKVLDFAGKELLNIGKFTFPEMKILPQGNGATALPVPWSSSSIFAGDQKRQLLYHCLNDKYLIEVYDQQGKKFRQIDRPYEPVPVTGEDIDKLKSRFTARPDSPVAILMEQMEFPRVKTVTERLLVDDTENLWVQTYEEKKEDEKTLTAFDIFNPDGIYEARVWLDFIPELFANGKMYRLAEDPQTGMELPKRYGIIWKEAP
jgi:hypothetical protein